MWQHQPSMLLKVLLSIIGFFLTKGQILPRVREAFSVSVFYITNGLDWFKKYQVSPFSGRWRRVSIAAL